MFLHHPQSQDLDLILKNLVESLKHWQLRSIGNDHVNVEMRVRLFIAGEYFLKFCTACGRQQGESFYLYNYCYSILLLHQQVCLTSLSLSFKILVTPIELRKHPL